MEPIELSSPESFSKKVVRGGIWIFALRIINRGLGFIRTIILARLLVPEDFGHELPWPLRVEKSANIS